MSEFCNFNCEEFEFNGREAKLVFPKGNSNGKFAMKMEYFGAFPELEKVMLENGYHIAYVSSDNRWGIDSDQDLRRDFADFLHEKYGLSRRFICIGMSCGGFQSVNFASRYPSYVSLLYLDAPLLSFEGWTGEGERFREQWRYEQVKAYGYEDPCQLKVNNDQPIHRLKVLTDNKLPCALVYGGADTVVDPDKNARALIAYYRLNNAPIKVWYKPDCDHHPHVAVSTDEIMEFIKENEL